MFGFVTAAKRPEVVVEAFARALKREPRLRLLIVGEPAPNIELAELMESHGVTTEQWQATGYVSDADFDGWLAAVDKVVNLRYPSAGETSGALYHIVAAGKAVAVSDYASFTDLPHGVAAKIAIDEREVEQLTEFLLTGTADVAAQRAWLAREGSLARAVATYVEAVSAPLRSVEVHQTPRKPIALFPRWQLLQSKATPQSITFELKNLTGDVIEQPSYLSPAYRVIVKFFAGAVELSSRWLAPPHDIAPQESVSWCVPRPAGATVMELHHALEMIPPVGLSRFVRLELVT
jgi:hypothetical protein